MDGHDDFVAALAAADCHPVEVAPGRVVARCPCCGHLTLSLGEDRSLPTRAERDAWLDQIGERRAGR
jgi:hypothetical protein